MNMTMHLFIEKKTAKQPRWPCSLVLGIKTRQLKKYKASPGKLGGVLRPSHMTFRIDSCCLLSEICARERTNMARCGSFNERIEPESAHVG